MIVGIGLLLEVQIRKLCQELLLLLLCQLTQQPLWVGLLGLGWLLDKLLLRLSPWLLSHGLRCWLSELRRLLRRNLLLSLLIKLGLKLLLLSLCKLLLRSL